MIEAQMHRQSLPRSKLDASNDRNEGQYSLQEPVASSIFPATQKTGLRMDNKFD